MNYPVANAHQFSLQNTSLEVSRAQFVPDGLQGLAVEYTMHNPGSNIEEFTFRFLGHSDLRPTWLGEKTGMKDGNDESSYLEEKDAWLVKDKLNSWFVMYGSAKKPIGKGTKENTLKGQGVSNYLDYAITLKPGESEILSSCPHFERSPGICLSAKPSGIRLTVIIPCPSENSRRSHSLSLLQR